MAINHNDIVPISNLANVVQDWGGVLGIARKPHTPFKESYVGIGQWD